MLKTFSGLTITFPLLSGWISGPKFLFWYLIQAQLCFALSSGLDRSDWHRLANLNTFPRPKNLALVRIRYYCRPNKEPFHKTSKSQAEPQTQETASNRRANRLFTYVIENELRLCSPLSKSDYPLEVQWFDLISKAHSYPHTTLTRMNLPYSIRMYWTNFWQPTVHIQQNIKKTLTEGGCSHLYASFDTFCIQIGNFFEAQWVF